MRDRYQAFLFLRFLFVSTAAILFGKYLQSEATKFYGQVVADVMFIVWSSGIPILLFVDVARKIEHDRFGGKQ